MMSHRFVGAVTSIVVGACGACGSEATSFRPTDSADRSERPGPPSAAYDVRMAEQPIALVHVWSKGGYLSASEEPMTHVGFDIHNTSARPIVFDSDALALSVFGHTAAALPATRMTSVEPLGPTERPIRPGETILLGAYFLVPVRPRAVETMQVQWALRAGDQRYLQLTGFARDDDDPVVAPHPVEAYREKS